MTVKYTIDEDDCLTQMLYTASVSDTIKKRRQRSQVIVPILYVAMGAFLLYLGQASASIIFIIIGVLWYFLFPFWERKRYRNYYKASIKESYKGRLGKMVTFELQDDYISAQDEGTESKVLTTELKEIVDIPTTLLVRLKGGQSFILPKEKIENISELTARLKALAEHLNIPFIIKDDWSWK
jgi:hypothetical protein